jgi:hypothetical protein
MQFAVGRGGKIPSWPAPREFGERSGEREKSKRERERGERERERRAIAWQ